MSFEKLTEDALGDGTLRHGVFQIYERSGNKTTLVSKGLDGKPIPPNEQNISANLLGVSPDGERVYISTEASLSAEDGDAGNGFGSYDDYELSHGGYRLLTTGPLDGPFPVPNATLGSKPLRASDDGTHVYFETPQRLTAEDSDNSPDIYAREGDLTRLVSTGPSATPSIDQYTSEPGFLGTSIDGATAYFSTTEQLTPDDPDARTSDIFSWHNGITRRLTHTVYKGEGPGIPFESFSPYSFGGAAEDGTLFYAANSSQVPEDTDNGPDIYAARPDGATQLLTPGPPVGDPYPEGMCAFHAEAASRDGSRVFFTTCEPLVPEDHDKTLDIYMWSNGRLRLITIGAVGTPKESIGFDAISRDGRRVFFNTWERLSPEDTDNEPDVYEWCDGRIRLVSPASDGRQSYASFDGISPNGRYVAFSTAEPLLGSDMDLKLDIYVIDMGSEQATASVSSVNHTRLRLRRRLRLVTAESIPPRMGIAANGSLGPRSVRLRLRCPKAERSGPCHGRVKLFGKSGHMAVKAG